MLVNEESDYTIPVLYEITYGVSETDERISEVSDTLYHCLYQQIKLNEFECSKKIYIKLKYIKNEYKQIEVLCKIDFAYKSEFNFIRSFYRKGIYDTIVFMFELPHGCSEYQKYNLVKQFFSDKNNVMLFLKHEVKHLLDEHDGIFMDKGSYKTPKDDIKAYYNQDQEVHAIFLTVIEDLKRLKSQNPDITFQEALLFSNWYKRGLERWSKPRMKKFKVKLVHFWKTQYGEI